MKIEWSETALGRVNEIVDFIAADDPEAAVRWAIELFAAVERLADFSGSGRMVPEMGDAAIREILHGAYRVLYQLGDCVQILTVRHCSQLLLADDAGFLDDSEV